MDDTKKQRILVLGDVHGAHKALKQVLERCEFNPEEDIIIFLGDVCDGWEETPECIDLFLTMPNLIAIKGNHDVWAMHWMARQLRMSRIVGYEWSNEYQDWTSNGGITTISAYQKIGHIPESHYRFLRDAYYWYQDENRVFVHGGFLGRHPIASSSEELTWDRELWQYAKEQHQEGRKKITQFDEVYIGHTTVWKESKLPMTACEITNMDTGGGWNGKLSIMDIDTKEVWQSDVVKTLYPHVKGR